MKDLTKFIHRKIMDTENIFENANATTDQIFLDGLLLHCGETNALLMAIGKRQAYSEVLDFILKEKWLK